MLIIITLNLLILFKYGDCAGTHLIDGEKYSATIAQEFIYAFEEYGLCNYELDPFLQEIKRSDFFGYEVKGNITYSNGFMHSLQNVKLKENYFPTGSVDEETSTGSFQLNLIFDSFILYYDYFADLSVDQFKGTVEIPLNMMQLQLNIKNFFLNDTVIHSIDVTGRSGMNPTPWIFQPSNHYTEIINKEARLDIGEALDKLAENEWNTILGQVIAKHPFPDFCLFCKN